MQGHFLRYLSSIGACLLLAPMACKAQQQGGARPSYDGRWWIGVSTLTQDGFLVGYLDCYHFEYKGIDRFHTKSYQRYRNLVTAFYSDDVAHLDQPLNQVVNRFRDKPGEKDQSPGGEPAHGEHWGHDGLYWRQANTQTHDEQLGFVEGYLYCHEALTKNRGGTFAKTAEEYRVLITRWYRYNENTDDIDPAREPTAIADVLFRVRNGLK